MKKWESGYNIAQQIPTSKNFLIQLEFAEKEILFQWERKSTASMTKVPASHNCHISTTYIPRVHYKPFWKERMFVNAYGHVPSTGLMLTLWAYMPTLFNEANLPKIEGFEIKTYHS